MRLSWFDLYKTVSSPPAFTFRLLVRSPSIPQAPVWGILLLQQIALVDPELSLLSPVTLHDVTGATAVDNGRRDGRGNSAGFGYVYAGGEPSASRLHAVK